MTPLEALRDTAEVDDATSRTRAWIARGLVVLGVARDRRTASSAPPSSDAALPLLGLGLILLFVGVAMLAGALVAPLASLVGRPIEKLRGVTGRLARENTLRNPGRTATTSAALMIGVALVVFAAIFASSANKSVNDALDKTFAGDLAITNTDGFSPFSPDIGPQVEQAERSRDRLADRRGARRRRAAGGPEQESSRARLQRPDEGRQPRLGRRSDDSTLTNLQPDEAIVESQWAEDNGVSVGDTITVKSAAGYDVQLHVVGSVRDRVQLLVPTIAAAGPDAAHAVRVAQPGLRRPGRLRRRAPTSTRPRTEVDDSCRGQFPEVEARSAGSSRQQQEDRSTSCLR